MPALRCGPLAAPKLVVMLGLLGGLLSLGACTKKPTQDQCNALADHMARLLSQAKVKNAASANVMKEKERDRFVMVCVREGSFEVVDCMLKAQSWDALIGQCGELVR